MESLKILQLSQLTVLLPSNPCNNKTRTSLYRSWKKRIARPTRVNCQKMYVPEQDYNREAHQELMEFLGRHSLNDGDKFIAKLMRESNRHQSLALRILEVRSAYCKNDFEWDNLQKLASKMVSESNTKLMRDYVLETSHGES